VNRQLAAILWEFESAQKRLDRLARETHSRMWNTRLAPAQWSPAECVAHLNLSSAAILPVVRGHRMREHSARSCVALPAQRHGLAGLAPDRAVRLGKIENAGALRAGP
jgi:hypothetical protein